MIQKATWIIPGILVTLLLGLLWAIPTLAAPSGAERGVAAILEAPGGDSLDYISPYAANASIYVQVTDEDENAPTKVEEQDARGSITVDAEEARFLADINDDGRENEEDFTILTDTDVDVTRHYVSTWMYTGTSTGTFSFDTYSGPGTVPSSVTVVYYYDQRTDIGSAVKRIQKMNAAGDPLYTDDLGMETTTEGVNEPIMVANPKYGRVVVKSNAHAAGISLEVSETGTLTGSFGTSVDICDADSVGCAVVEQLDEMDEVQVPVLPVNSQGDRITLEYKDKSPSGTRRATVTVETDVPDFSNLSPAHGAAGDDDDPEFSANVTDAGSEIDDDEDADATVKFVFGIRDAAADKTWIDGPFPVLRRDIEEEAISDGFSFTTSFRSGTDRDLDPGDSEEYEIVWWVVAIDQAGNMGVSDQKGASVLTGKVSITDTNAVADSNSDDMIDMEDIEADTLDERQMVTGVGTKFDEELKAGDTITVAGQTRIVASAADALEEDSGIPENAPITDTAVWVTEGFTRTRNSQISSTGNCLGRAFDTTAEDAMPAIAGCDPHVVRVDEKKPTLEDAVAGNWVKDNVVQEGAKADRTSIELIFSEAVDCDAIQASDLEVDGDNPLEVNCYSKFPNSVFLTVPEMAPDATPDIEIVGDISDEAGNQLSAGDDDTEVTASDGIPAALEIVVEGSAEDRAATDETITVTIRSDEKLGTRPRVQIHQVFTNSMVDDDDGNNLSDDGSPTGNDNEYEVELDLDSPGLYSVYVTATDLGGDIAGSKGVAPEDLDSITVENGKAILFEVDTGIPAPDISPGTGDDSTDDPNAFLKIDFAMEGNEYGLKESENRVVTEAVIAVADDTETDGDTSVAAKAAVYGDFEDATSTPSDVDTNFDTHKTVTLTKATLDGPGYDSQDVTDSFTSRNSVVYLWRPLNLALGEYTLTVEYQDAAGNEDDSEHKFEVVAPKPYKLDLQAGANLVSIPAAAVDSDINAVFGGEDAIVHVLTYDNASGLWMAAVRDESGMFVGDLTKVDARHAYWVSADEQLTLNVALAPESGLGTLPPAIEIYQGWNLVPMVSVIRGSYADVEADTYFAGVSWSVAYGFDPIDGFTKVVEVKEAADAANDISDDLQFGRGYWVYANEKGVIIP